MDLLKVFQTESLDEIQDLITSGGIPIQFEWLNYAALNSALENGRTDIAELLLARNCCVNSFSILPLNSSPLHNAVKLANPQLVANLLVRGANILSIDTDGNTPLHLAFLHKNKVIIDIMLNYMVQMSNYVNARNNQGLSHLHIACTASTSNNLKMVTSYLKAGALIMDSVSNKSALWAGFTALHFAVEFKCLSVLKVLSTSATKLDYMIKDSKGRTPRDLLKHNLQELLVMDKILSEGSLSYFELTCLQDTEKSSDVLNSFIQHGVDVNSQIAESKSFCSKYTPLHFAVSSGNPENVKVLLKNKANSQILNTKQMTPLHQAFYHEELYIDSSASKEIVDLLYAAVNDKEVNLQDVNGLNYLHIACARNDSATVKKILSSGGNVNSKICYDRKRFSHYTPLHFAVKYKQLEVAKLLIKNGADVNANKNSVHGTPLHLAFLVGYVEMIELLLEYGADPKAVCLDNGATVLHILVDCCVNRTEVSIGNQIYVSYIDKLVNLGVDVNAQDPTGFTPLHVACTGNESSCVLRLLSLGADVNLKNKDGKTPFEMIFQEDVQGQDKVLYYLIFYEHVQKLKELGLTVRVKNNECCEKVLLKINKLEQKARSLLAKTMDTYKKQRADEIVKMKDYKIDEQVSLLDFVKMRPKRAVDFMCCKELLKIFEGDGLVEKKYPAFGYFVKLQYMRGVKDKGKLMKFDDDRSSKMSDSLESKVRD